MPKFIQISLVTSLLIAIGCSSQKTFSPDDLTQPFIALGNGGGFTGKTTTFYLLNNGQVYKGSEFTREFTMIGKIDQALVKQQWKTYNDLKIDKIQINDPGNFYYFLEFKSKKSQHRMVWQELNKDHQLIQTIYNNLNNTINTISKTNNNQKI